MKLYSQLSKIAFLKNRYVAKFLFVAFLGIHIPLIGLVFFVVYLEHNISPLNIFLITLLLTLFATALTLIILNNLMIPVIKGSKALTDYRLNRTVPRLPLNYTDEAGVMLQNIQATIQMNQKLLVEKKELMHLLTNDLRNQTEHTAIIIKDIFNETEKEEVKNLASLAVKTIHQQIGFVDSFVDLLKEETLINAEQVKIRKVHIESVLQEVKRNFKAKLEDKNIDLQLDVHIPEVVLKTNSKLLQQAFSYLIDNAIKSSSQGAKVNVTVEKSQGRLMIYVRDFGTGFETGQSEKIFTRFSSMNNNSENHTPGIGLYLTRTIIERFSGTVIAESGGLDRGAVFTIELKMYR